MYANKEMKNIRVVIYLEPAQVAALQRIQARTGAAVTEMCRRAVAEWIERQGNNIKP